MTQEQKFNCDLHRLLDSIREKCETQFKYNCETNVPKGIVAIDDTADNAIRLGLVSALGKHLDWSIPDALTLAADIAEDVNAHDEAAQIRAMFEPVLICLPPKEAK
jgi:hypothetical protein